ncbi:MAG TPA: hypothetical protein VKV73_20370 [Chloroflexota bacterium]|nr:hypothetical protein [Chloroflexota bacterium]
MGAASVLIAQLHAAIREFRRMERVLDAEAIDADLRARVHARFDVEFRRQRAALEGVQDEITRGQPPDEGWAVFDNIRRDTAVVYQEFLAFTSGALQRSAGLDDGLGGIADSLLDTVAAQIGVRWNGFTVTAPDVESYVDLAELIRLRFADVTIWNLPVAVHEFGHFVGPELFERGADNARHYRFKDYLDQEAQLDPKNGGFVHEQFADLFATYAIGPAYPCVCILLRFTPATAHVDGDSHPSAAKRVYLMLKWLERLEAGRLIRHYRDVTEVLRSIWHASLGAVGQDAELPAEDRAILDTRLLDLGGILETLLPSGVRYASWTRAEQLATAVSEWAQREYADDLPATVPSDTPGDVLNAAWLVRLAAADNDLERVGRVGGWAHQACRKLAMARARAARSTSG